ncbi:MAG: hypothetical protein K0S08_573 [Gammaproteobacteria bacterium]|jgi:hypothetical protein|nr:hypothetical protein [Gammaproteobacteria bacterium]
MSFFFCRKFPLLFLLLVSLLLSQPAYAVSQLQNEINLISTSISKAVKFVEVNNATDGYNLANFSNLNIASQSLLLSSLTIDNVTGKIDLVVAADRPAVSRAIRGLTISLTPKYYSADDQSYHAFNRTNGDGSHKIETWSCTINNASAGADFSIYRTLGRIYNVFVQSQVLDPELENALSKYCSNTTIVV